ncbi:MAG TPA: hypothetical protein VLZ84_11155, partial [Asticcacaulis sp.]|nr:hypothetical protein [Asticcacaulis sp.]
MTTIGYIGDELTLLIRQGCDFETVEVTYLDVASAVPLTNCTLKGAIADQYGVKKADMAVAVTDAAGGKYTIDISNAESAKLIAMDKSSPLSRYQFQIELTDADGKIRPHYYGPVNVQR